MTDSQSFTIYQRNSLTYFFRSIQTKLFAVKVYAKLLLFFMHQPAAKYIVCRPQGGLNDILVQITVCLIYSYKYNRSLVIDTKKSGILDDFNNYFQPIFAFNNFSLKESESLKRDSQFMSCLPKSLLGRGLNYESEFRFGINYVDVDTCEKLTFSFDRDHWENLLIHEQCGGGDIGIFTLHFLTLNERVKKEVRKRLSILPDLYIAIHVRNTDVKTNFIELFKSVKEYVHDKNLLVCTDSMEVLNYAKVYFKNTNVFSLSNIPDSKGESLHHNPKITDWSINVGALTDLFAMSLSQKLILPSKDIGYLSGFANLGRMLFERKYLVNQLLN